MADTVNMTVPQSSGQVAQPSTDAVKGIETPSNDAVKDIKTDPRFEQFAKKERQIRRMQSELAVEKQRLAKQAAEYESGYISKASLKSDLWSVLADAGIDPTMLSEQLLSQPNMNDPTTKALMSKLRAIEAKQQASEKAAQESQATQYQQALKQMGSDIKIMIDGNPAYELIQENGAYDAVVELIEQEFNKTGILMDMEDAAKDVESYIEEQLLRAAKAKKMQAKLGLKTEEQKLAETVVKAQDKARLTITQKQPQLKTITNSVDATPQTGRRSEKERIARAMAAFNGTLKG